MTEPSGRPRRRRNSSSPSSRLRGLPRPVVVLGALAIVVITAAESITTQPNELLI